MAPRDGVSDPTPEPESGGGNTWQHSWQCTQLTWHRTWQYTWSVGIIAGVSDPTPEPEQSAVRAHYKQRDGGDTWQHTSQCITYLHIQPAKLYHKYTKERQ